MNCFERIKTDLYGERNRRGNRETSVVDTRSLLELLRHYESLDSEARALHPEGRRQEINEQLHHMITASYIKQGKNAETTLMLIMDTLRPLMEQKEKDAAVKARWHL